ncbi:MAG TPA: hypothetical protein VFV19_15355 [Candidatus Polarisedimenticolaceae bacterium]|nr:hypothetical protein [Candidatus Polarisedimenticolaceae bacterium]
MTEPYDRVRRQLVEHGYLQGPIERFVLRDLGFLRAAFKASVIGGPLLGALLAASTVAANRPALGARDALVLWGYFAALAGVSLFVLDLLGASAARAWARRRGARPSDSVRAGLLVAAPVLAYVVAVWAVGRPERGLSEDALFLAGAVAVSAMIAWLAGIVSLAAIVGATGEVPDRNRRAAAAGAAVLVPLAAVVLLLPVWRAGSAHPVPASPFQAPARADRVLVAGIDGLDGALVEALAPSGAVDHLLAAIARGAMSPTHRADGLEPAEVWTTIATGMPAEMHGVRAAGARRLPGVAAPIAGGTGPAALDAALRFLLPSRTVPSSGAGRRVRTVWEIAALAHPSVSVGWWASWPARGTEGDPAGGYVVSDRALVKLLAGSREDRDTSPASLFDRLAGTFAADRDGWRRECAERFATIPEGPRALVCESLVIDAFAWTSATRLTADPAAGSAFVYLPGLDILRTRLARTPPGTAEALVAAQAIEGYVRWLDARVFATLGAGWASRVVLIADPGRSAGADAEGFVAVTGPGAVPACVGPTIGDLDVAPVILRALDLPASKDMPGKSPARCFEDSSPPPIATWGRRGAPAVEALSDEDPEVLERLRSLGYVR